MDLPLFPLHLVLFPGRPLPLHLFEPRYCDMLRDCLAGDRQFGVVAIREGREVGGAAQTYDVGTITEIEAVQELSDGRFDILTRGQHRFRVTERFTDRPYLHGHVEPLADPPCGAAEDDAAAQLKEVLVPYLHHLGIPDEYCRRLPEDPGELAYLAAAALQVEVPVQQRLLEMATPAERLLETARIIKREAGIIKHLGMVGSFRPPGPCGVQLN